MTGTKSREPLAATDVLRIFDDACIDRLAERLPAGANRKHFAEGIREAACIYAKDARTPTHSELHTEITALYRAAERKRYGQVAALLEKLSSKASDLLNKRATRLSLELPTSDYLRDGTTQQTASEAVLRLCQYGGQYIEGRRRPSGKRSLTWRPLLVATKAHRNSPTRISLPAGGRYPRGGRRDAERTFIIFLQLAWLEATGKQPSLAANPARPGPFVRMVRKCLKLVGAGHADAVGLINELNRWRKEAERKTSVPKIQRRAVRPEN
jgi:hypothetical protein